MAGRTWSAPDQALFSPLSSASAACASQAELRRRGLEAHPSRRVMVERLLRDCGASVPTSAAKATAVPVTSAAPAVHAGTAPAPLSVNEESPASETSTSKDDDIAAEALDVDSDPGDDGDSAGTGSSQPQSQSMARDPTLVRRSVAQLIRSDASLWTTALMFQVRWRCDRRRPMRPSEAGAHRPCGMTARSRYRWATFNPAFFGNSACDAASTAWPMFLTVLAFFSLLPIRERRCGIKTVGGVAFAASGDYRRRMIVLAYFHQGQSPAPPPQHEQRHRRRRQQQHREYHCQRRRCYR